MSMSQEDAEVACALLVRHGWTAYHYYDGIVDHAWNVTASWPPMQIEAHEMGAPDAAWRTIRTLREAVRTVWFCSAKRRPMTHSE